MTICSSRSMKSLSVLLVLAMVFSLFPLMPMGAEASGAATANIMSDQTLFEPELDGRSLTVTLTNDTFSDSVLDEVYFTLNNAPTGLSVQSVVYNSSTEATIYLAFDGPDFDNEFIDFNVTIQGQELTGGSSLTSNDLPIMAVVETGAATANIISDQTLLESELNGRMLTVTLTNDTFSDSVLDEVYFTLNNAPTGLSVQSVVYDSATQATINLAFDGTDFDTDVTDFNVTIQSQELAGGSSLTSNDLLISAEIETGAATANIISDQTLLESELNGRSLTVTLTNDTFSESVLDEVYFTLNNAPTGLSVQSVVYDSATQATINLAFDGTDFDSDVTDFNVTIQGQELTGGSSLTSNNLTITSVIENSPSLSNDANLTNLTPGAGTLVQVFNQSVTEYKVTLPSDYGTSVPTITVTKSDPNATHEISNAATLAGTTIIVVTAEDGVTTKTYTISFEKKAAITEDVAVTEENKHFEITASTPTATITIPQGIQNATVTVQTTSTGQAQESTMPSELSINATVAIGQSNGVVQVKIPAGTKITGPANWDGTINLPAFLTLASVDLTNEGTFGAAVEVGLVNESLTFDKAVRLVIPGQAGKAAGYIKDGKLVKITTTLSADTQAAGDALPAGGDGKIDVGNDLVIWTKHFTEFVSYTPVVVSSGGGGGGGGAVSTTSNTVKSAEGGAVKTNGVTITIPANATASDIKITAEKVTNVSSLPMTTKTKLISDVYEILKDKAGNFEKQVTIILPYDKSKVDTTKYDMGIYWLNEETQKWVALNNVQIDTVVGTVSGEVNHFTKFAVIATEKAGQVTTETVLKDITGHWAENTIKEMVDSGAIKGYPDATFKPNNTITRAEFAIFLVRAFKLAPQSGKVFTDTANHWAKNDIATAAAYGIVSGYDADTFAPNDFITREQMASMIVRAAKLTMVTEETSFADDANISPWAKGAIATAAQNGIIKGYPDNTVRPKGNATRAEAVTVIINALK